MLYGFLGRKAGNTSGNLVIFSPLFPCLGKCNGNKSRDADGWRQQQPNMAVSVHMSGTRDMLLWETLARQSGMLHNRWMVGRIKKN